MEKKERTQYLVYRQEYQVSQFRTPEEMNLLFVSILRAFIIFDSPSFWQISDTFIDWFSSKSNWFCINRYKIDLKKLTPL